jgi:tungstate transport system substrate-binding protein
MGYHPPLFKSGIMVLIVILLVGTLLLAGCTSQPPATTTTTTPSVSPTQTGPREKLVLATTTSLYDTGLLDFLKPMYEAQYNAELLITSQGTGKAIEIAKAGDCDILAVHSPSQETAFMMDGAGVNRRCFAYNYFVIVGPASDPAKIKGLSPEEAFKQILAQGKAGTAGVAFVSRGDNSGTHSAEKTIWGNAKLVYGTDVQKSGDWYIEAGRGMGETLQMASEKGAYTLTDEGTFLAYKSNLNLVPIVVEGTSLLNVYSVIIPYFSMQTPAKMALANDFVDFLLAPGTQKAIGEFGKEKYGKNLFSPMNGQCTKFSCDCIHSATATRPALVFHAGSLAAPFAKIKAIADKANPSAEVELFSNASQSCIDMVTKYNKPADVLASADYYLIPKFMIPQYADFYVNFAMNQMVIAYTNKSDYASEITADNWYDILGRDGVTYMISDPATDPGGYRSLMVFPLAEKKYGKNTIFSSLIKDHSGITSTTEGQVTIIDVTNPSADSKKFFIYKTADEASKWMTDGTVDYRFAYKNVAIQNNLSYITLPPEIDLSDKSLESTYKMVKVKRAAGTEEGLAILYGVTVPKISRNPNDGIAFIKALLSPEGQAVLKADGLTPLVPPVAYGTVPESLAPLVTQKS